MMNECHYINVPEVPQVGHVTSSGVVIAITENGRVVTDKHRQGSFLPSALHRTLNKGEEKYFIKSGNKVKLLERSDEYNWRVVRLTGASRGKEMICPERSLIDHMEFA